MSEHWKWLDGIAESSTCQCCDKMISAYQVVKLLKCIAEMRWALEEIHNQSIAHDDDSLSSKWLTQITGEALARCQEGKAE